MPSLASGHSCCTAWASTWAVEWRRMSRPSALSIATGSTSSPSSSTWDEVPQLARRPAPRPRRASSVNSSHALVPVVTVRSSRASAASRAILISDTGRLLRRVQGPVEPNGRLRRPARRYRPPAARGSVAAAAVATAAVEPADRRTRRSPGPPPCRCVAAGVVARRRARGQRRSTPCVAGGRRSRTGSSRGCRGGTRRRPPSRAPCGSRSGPSGPRASPGRRRWAAHRAQAGTRRVPCRGAGPHDVAGRRAVLGVEEARHPQLGDRLARDPGLDAGQRVAAGGERVDEAADLVGVLQSAARPTSRARRRRARSGSRSRVGWSSVRSATSSPSRCSCSPNTVTSSSASRRTCSSSAAWSRRSARTARSRRAAYAPAPPAATTASTSHSMASVYHAPRRHAASSSEHGWSRNGEAVVAGI